MTSNEALTVLQALKATYPSNFKNYTKEDAVNFAREWSHQFREIPVKYVLIATRTLISQKAFAPSLVEVKQELIGMVWDARFALSTHYHGTYPLPEDDVKEKEDMEKYIGSLSPIIR